MIQDEDKRQSDTDSELEREIRDAREFTLEEALGRIAGPGAMKGASPVSPQQQAEIAIGTWLGSNLADPAGALRIVVHRHLKGSKSLLDNQDRPLAALAEHCRHAGGAKLFVARGKKPVEIGRRTECRLQLGPHRPGSGHAYLLPHDGPEQGLGTALAVAWLWDPMLLDDLGEGGLALRELLDMLPNAVARSNHQLTLAA